MAVPKKPRDIDVELNYRWIKNIYNIMDKIEKYQAIVDDEQNTEEMRKAFAKEIEFQQQDLEDLKKLVSRFKSGLSKLLFKKYVEGYTIEEAAIEMGYSRQSLSETHANFTRKLKEKGLAI